MHPALLLCTVFSPGSSSEPEGGPDPRCSRAPVFLPHPLSAVDLLLQSARPGDAHGLLPLLTRPLCWARAVPGAGSEASGRREPLPAPHTRSSEGPGRPTCRAVLAETRRAGRCFQYLGVPCLVQPVWGFCRLLPAPRACLRTVAAEGAVGPTPRLLGQKRAELGIRTSPGGSWTRESWLPALQADKGALLELPKLRDKIGRVGGVFSTLKLKSPVRFAF